MQQYSPEAMKNITDLNWGIRVERDAAQITVASVPIFTINVGAVVMLSLIGTVTVVIPAAACTIHIDTAPTAGATTALSTLGGSISGFAVGRQFHLAATVAAHVNSTGGAFPDVCPNWVLPVGTLNLHGETAATTTGLVKWTMVYVPFDEGAYVTAA